MKKKLLSLVLAAIVIYGLGFWMTVEQRAIRFINKYGAEIEAAYLTNDFPENFGGKEYSVWNGEHPMVEFVFSGWGLAPSSVYCGCYYSPDNVPLAFQNTEHPLIRLDINTWTWHGEGDNWGKTVKIRDNWYYYNVHF